MQRRRMSVAVGAVGLIVLFGGAMASLFLPSFPTHARPRGRALSLHQRFPDKISPSVTSTSCCLGKSVPFHEERNERRGSSISARAPRSRGAVTCEKAAS